MPDGTGSTLSLHPRGASDITLSVGNVSTYFVPLQTLDFNEEQRWQAIYDDARTGEGGEVVGESAPLVPLVFQCRVRGATRAAVIQAYNTLKLALINQRGGTLEYKPEDLAAGVLSTFYHYVQSAPPRLLDVAGNRWDAAARSDDGQFAVWVECELKTQPIATSDPDSPVTLTDLDVTIQNWEDAGESQTNQVLINGGNIKGSMPALLRFTARPGAGQAMGRLIVFKRDEGTLANFKNIYEAEGATVIYPSTAWNEESDENRGGGAYMLCAPDSGNNGIQQGLRFLLDNPADHEGRFAVFGVGRDGAETRGVWTHQVKLRAGNVVQEGRDDYEAESLRSFQYIYAGEFELPIVPFSDDETDYAYGPYIEWYSQRASGGSEFRLDAIELVFVSDSKLNPTALDVPCADEDGVTEDERLLVENFSDSYGNIRELAHVLASGV